MQVNQAHRVTEANTYPIGQCTWGVKELAPWVRNYWGNANQWGILLVPQALRQEVLQELELSLSGQQVNMAMLL